MGKEAVFDEKAARAAVAEISIGGDRSGTGFFFTEKLLFTCDHVVAGTAAGLTVTLHDGRKLEASQVLEFGVPDLDVAVLSVEEGLAPAILPVTMEPLSVGDHVWTTGFQVGDSITSAVPSSGRVEGQVSTVYSRSREYRVPQAVRIRDLRANFGASGAPLLALPEGVALGMTIAKYLTQDNLILPFSALRGTTLGKVFDASSKNIPVFGRYLNYAGARQLCSAQTHAATQLLTESRQYLPDQYISRQECEQQLSRFIAAPRSRIFPLVGDSGAGKSSLLAALASRASHPFLILLAGHRVSLDRGMLREAIDAELHESSGERGQAEAIANVASQSRQPLVILFDALNEIVGPQALLRPWLERTFAWLKSMDAFLAVSARQDFWSSIRDLIPDRLLPSGSDSSAEPLGDFSDVEASAAVHAYGLPEVLVEQPMFRRPVFLRMYAELGTFAPEGRVSHATLLKKYVADKAKKASSRLPIPPAPSLVELLLERIAAHAGRGLDIPRGAVLDEPRVTPELVQVLLSENLLLDTDAGFRFVFDEVGEYLLSKSFTLPGDEQGWFDWLQTFPLPGAVRFAILRREEDAERILRPLISAIPRLPHINGYRYRMTLFDTVARMVTPPVEMVADYLRADLSAIDDFELKEIATAISRSHVSLRDRLGLLQALAPAQNYYPWREGDWSDKPVDTYNHHVYVRLLRLAFEEDPATAIDSLVGWLDDGRKLRGDHHEREQDGSAEVADISAALLFEQSGVRLDAVCEALANRLAEEPRHRVGSILHLVGARQAGAVEEVARRWEWAGREREGALVSLLDGVCGTRTPPEWAGRSLMTLSRSVVPAVSAKALRLLAKFPYLAGGAFEALRSRYLARDANVDIYDLTPFAGILFDDFLGMVRKDQFPKLQDLDLAMRSLPRKTLTEAEHAQLITFLEEASARSELRRAVGNTLEVELNAIRADDPSFGRLAALTRRFIAKDLPDGRIPIHYFMVEGDHDGKQDARRALIDAVIDEVQDEEDLGKLLGLMIDRYAAGSDMFGRIVRLAERLGDADMWLIRATFLNNELADEVIRSNIDLPHVTEMRNAVKRGENPRSHCLDVLQHADED